MGVKDLWQLLEPVGRRINIEALTNKQLAVDASIWLHQFIKAMRNDKGEVMQNAHLLGFFRRICRLMFHKIRPIFVFDGATPVLKRRTTIARRRRREQQTAQLRKTAEKLLLNQLKKHALEAQKASRHRPATQDKLASNDAEVVIERIVEQTMERALDSVGEFNGRIDSSALDELLVAQLNAEELGQDERGILHAGAQAQPPNSAGQEPQNREGASAGQVRGAPDGEDVTLAQALVPLASEDDEEEGGDEDDEDEMILLPEGMEGLDPAVLSTLPQSMQLEAMQRLRERMTHANRDKFQQQAVNPSGFSVLQMQEYLKASKFRRQMDGLKDAMNAAAMAGSQGVPAKRIASEVDRQYILTREDKPEVAPARSFPLQPPQAPVELVKPNDGIEVELPEGATLEALLAKSDSDEGTSEEPVEWEEVGEGKQPAITPRSRRSTDSGPGGSTGKTWRDRMAQRQKYWSLSHGFKFGRKLADWSKSDEQEEMEDVMEAAGIGEEEAEIQEAIRRSVMDLAAARGGSSSDSDSALQFSPRKRDGNYDGAGPSSATVVPPGSSGAAPMMSPPLRQADGRSQQGSEAPGASQAQGLSREGNSHPDLCRPQGLPVSIESEAEGLRVVSCKASTTPGTLPGTAQPAPLCGDTHVALQESAPARSQEIRMNTVPGESDAALATAGDMTVGTFRRKAEQEGRDSGPSALGSDATDRSPLYPTGELELRVPQPDSSSSEPTAVDASPSTGEMHSPSGTAAKISAREGTEGAVEMDSPDTGQDQVLTEASLRDPGTLPKATGLNIKEVEETLAQPDDWDFMDDLPASQPGPDLRQAPETTSMANGSGSTSQMIGGPHREGPPAEIAGYAGPSFDLDAELENLEVEGKALEAEVRRQQIAGDTPTNEMYGECQELLQMFGIPYIIAPMEAEAQCAWLDANGLVNGVVTDDNDVFLFGAERVYRNIFSDKKYVEEYRVSDVQSELGLDQVKLIQLALLLGSDYTEGVHGIGIVNAVEVVNAFPGEDGLEDFKEWVVAPDEQLLALARGETSAGEGNAGVSDGVKEFRRRHASVRKNWDLPEDFPQRAIMQAYMNPRVDDSKQNFTYGRPDLELLRQFCWDKFGWTQDKTEQLLLPVLKAFDERHTQTTMTQFLSFSQRFAKFKSVRLQRAVKGVSGKGNDELHFLDPDANGTPHKKREKSAGGGAGNNDEALMDGSGSGERSAKKGRRTTAVDRKAGKRKRAQNGAPAKRGRKPRTGPEKTVAEMPDNGAISDLEVSDASEKDAACPPAVRTLRQRSNQVTYAEGPEEAGSGGSDIDWEDAG